MSTDTDQDENDAHWSVTEGPDQWVDTGHDRVWARNGADAQYVNGRVHDFADQFPDHTVVVTGGPYRSHDVQYRLEDEAENVIHLDFYSVRPGYDRLDEVADAIRAAESLPEGPDDRGIEPFTVAGFEWQQKRGDEIEEADRIPNDNHGVLYVCETHEIDRGDETFIITPLVHERVNSPLTGTVFIFDNPDFDLELESVDEAAEYATAQVWDPDADYWTLQPVDESNDD